MKRVYIKQECCMACHLCEVYCRLQQSQSKDLIKAFRRESPRPIPRLQVQEKGALSFPVSCQHCGGAPCVYACITGALTSDPASAVVRVDEERCVGCWTCLLACPFGAIKQDKTQGKIVKCDLCHGEDVPVCVSNCPNEALVYAALPEEAEHI